MADMYVHKLAVFALSTASALLPVWTQAAETAPYRIQAGTPIDCGGTPFGSLIPMGIDHEAVLLRRRSNGAVESYQYDGQQLVLQRESVLGVAFNGSRIASVRADINGDGDDELVIASGQTNGSFNLLAVRASPFQPGSNFWSGGYFWNRVEPGSFLTDLQIAAADLDGSGDGRLEVVVAYRNSAGTVKVLAFSGDGSGNVLQSPNTAIAEWTMTAGEAAGVDRLRLAAGDLLLEGRDQVIVTTRNPNAGGVISYHVLRATGSASGGAPQMSFSHRRFTEGFSAEPLENLSVHVGDLGGSAAAEMIVHWQERLDGTVQWPRQRLRYFNVVRDSNNQITDYSFVNTGALEQSISSNGSAGPSVAAIGEVDRVPRSEIVVARGLNDDGNGNRAVRVELHRARFSTAGLPIGLGPLQPPVYFDVPVSGSEPAQLDLKVGDTDGDAVGDVLLAFRDWRAAGNVMPVTKLRRLAMDSMPGSDAPPEPSSFSLRAQLDLSSDLADSVDLHIAAADWDQDSMLARLGGTCRRVREPQVRTMVNLPPFWSRLQAGGSGFYASIGSTRDNNTSSQTQYDTFVSHDISGSVGLGVEGQVFGVGARVLAKITAGGNWQEARGAVSGSEIGTAVTQTQSVTQGGGLVVIEENTFDCYDYEVERFGQPQPASNLRACEVRRTQNGSSLRSMIASSRASWDTVTAAGTGGITPAQWTPLQPDWANLALFRAFYSSNGVNLSLPTTDGNFSTGYVSGLRQRPYVVIDLGREREISSIRVFPMPGRARTLAGLTAYLSNQEVIGIDPPSGADVRVFAPDPRTQNGVDRWNVWTRSASSPFAPVRGRYLRIQHPGPEQAELALAEIQVFGDVHREPPEYPIAVCDPVSNDGLFTARVFSDAWPGPSYRNVQVRGDLLWTGTPHDPACGSNHATLPTPATTGFAPIWSEIEISGDGDNRWDLASNASSYVGQTRSISHSNRVGADLEFEASAFALVTASASYSFATGATETESSTMYWGTGLQYSGGVSGFAAGSNPDCAYKTHPYAYRAIDLSNTGYTHQYTVVDYIVPPFEWDMVSNPPPSDCFPVTAPPTPQIFSNGFED
jgi:hypothetical protein